MTESTDQKKIEVDKHRIEPIGDGMKFPPARITREYKVIKKAQ